MKRFFALTFLFIAFTFLGCFVYSNVMISVPLLISSTVSTYKMYTTLLCFFEYLPAVLFAGSVVVLCVIFSATTGNIKHRFSQAMYGLYKKVFVLAIIMVAILTFISQISRPLVLAARNNLEQRPTLFNEYLNLARNALEEGEPDIAYSYADKALRINASSQIAEQLLRKAEMERKSSWDILNTSDLPNIPFEIEEPEEVAIPDEVRAYSALELIDTSKKAAVKGDWFAAHYYAQLAVKIASLGDVDINLNEAKRLSAEAWNKLSAMEKTGDPSVQKKFATKRKGYTALMDGDNLQAYYIFNRLAIESREHSPDPDVTRYLALAKERLEKQYFFFDETQDLDRFETIHNMYFKITNTDSSTTMVLVRGATDLKTKGNLVRYLRNLTICKFSNDGRFIYSLEVPSAKMLAVEHDGKKVPCILLKSMDRYKENTFIEPIYQFAPDLSEESYPNNRNYQMLEMPYDDITLLASVSYGIPQMDLISLIKFAPIASKYGYSKELAMAVIGDRLLYPFGVFILFFFFASFAWNYRLRNGQIFKFKWVVFIPLLSIIMYFILESVQYLFRVVNLVLVARFAQSQAVLMAIVLYMVLFVVMSVLFLSRTE